VNKRPIKTVFYRHDATPIVNSSCDPDRAAGVALVYMRANKYSAHTCEVYNADTGIDYVSMRWTKAGVLEVVEKLPTEHPLAPKR
jgi:hypothetical protein